MKNLSRKSIESNPENVLVFDLRKNFFKPMGLLNERTLWAFGVEIFQSYRLLLTKVYYGKESGIYYTLKEPVDKKFLKTFTEVVQENLGRRYMKLLPNIAKLKKKGPEVLRHLYMQHLVENGARIEDVKKLVGHSSLDSTLRHLPKITSTEIKQNFLSCHPKA